MTTMDIEILSLEAVTVHNGGCNLGSQRAATVSATLSGEFTSGTGKVIGDQNEPRLPTDHTTTKSAPGSLTKTAHKSTDSGVKIKSSQTGSKSKKLDFVTDRSQTRTTMLRGLLNKTKTAESEGPQHKTNIDPNSGTSLTTMLLMKRRLNRWRASKAKTWGMVGGQSQSGGSCVSAVENTYKLKPDDDKRFLPGRAKEVTHAAMERILLPQDHYDQAKASILVKLMSEEIKCDIKKLDYNRHKLVVHVTLGQDQGQGVQVASQAVWDMACDSSTTVTYRTGDLFAVASIFATYYE